MSDCTRLLVLQLFFQHNSLLSLDGQSYGGQTSFYCLFKRILFYRIDEAIKLADKEYCAPLNRACIQTWFLLVFLLLLLLKQTDRRMDRWMYDGWTDNLCWRRVEVWNETQCKQLLKCSHWADQRRFCCPSQLRVSHLTRTHTHPCTADVCESSNEAFFVSVSQGLGCSSAEMRPTMLSLRFWSSRVRSCSRVTSHRTDILANTRTHTILAASFLLSLNLVELGALLTKILGMPGLSCTELQTISLMRVA